MRVLASLFILCIGFGVVAQSNDDDDNSKNGPKITFSESVHDFGDIKQGDRVSHTFTYENTGNEPLIISSVKTTCGCTATNWSREPLAPGESSEITVNFNSRGKVGKQNKTVRVMSNAVNSTASVRITTNVLTETIPGVKADTSSKKDDDDDDDEDDDDEDDD
ncbi:DUF1573 domain-containing protein [Marinoscillum furvescens]|uniref:Uncharacterized protein DUF1573 n=1 Tax=Marinoscillum furvescens DSM 4134 TaxID=1122208 RepID=A0A3D9L376_MARFU|nr:DUF1573 domain-containing protein [Marinoscillum furvescens]RED97508.1 uncharacterized protein DUF1573 [Marinoscillum furvescens DSM 4134]